MSGRHRRNREPVPPHLQDQINAAEREATQTLTMQAALMGVPVEHNNDEDDPNVEVLFMRIVTAITGRRALGCPHASSPRPLWLHAWEQPYVLRCQACEAVSPNPTPLEDRTCDVCGEMDPEGTWPSALLKGSITILMGRCDNCMPPAVLARKRAEQGR